jgi:hypothetical protein
MLHRAKYTQKKAKSHGVVSLLSLRKRKWVKFKAKETTGVSPKVGRRISETITLIQIRVVWDVMPCRYVSTFRRKSNSPPPCLCYLLGRQIAYSSNTMEPLPHTALTAVITSTIMCRATPWLFRDCESLCHN